MKTFKKIAFLFLCMFLFQGIALPSVIAPVQVEAATKSGLKKEKGKYYYYVKGKRVKKTWKTVNRKKYYFGKTGAAYKAPADEFARYHVVLKKVGTKYYGFDSSAVMAKGGVRTNLTGTVYVFKSTGLYDKTMTLALRSAVKNNDLEAAFKILGPWKSRVESDRCDGKGSMGVIYRYPYVTVGTIIDGETHIESFESYLPIYCE